MRVSPKVLPLLQRPKWRIYGMLIWGGLVTKLIVEKWVIDFRVPLCLGGILSRPHLLIVEKWVVDFRVPQLCFEGALSRPPRCKNKIQKVAKIKDKVEWEHFSIFLLASHVLIFKEKKVGIPNNLFSRRIAGHSGRRDSQDRTQMIYCDTFFNPFLPYKMITHWMIYV